MNANERRVGELAKALGDGWTVTYDAATKRARVGNIAGSFVIFDTTTTLWMKEGKTMIHLAAAMRGMTARGHHTLACDLDKGRVIGARALLVTPGMKPGSEHRWTA